ncbi:hypothetical protein SAMN04488029_2654 [Reichenbachiella faecimaris]|uniref:HPt domain-containing protein n=1 Tax=Reichenbachiella faecimaris TaxID=692418 RepID=A0A1W2GI89_REIFA|nr:hypothetical protein [Reichenbachiella faecimaris]SMD36006.1 hypothetical protein SAMN04488029_2654 [Reichenbachiella faecimaris]
MINFNYLNEVFSGDAQLIDDVLDIYISEYPEFEARFANCMARREMEEISKMAHKWQFTAKVLGLVELKNDLIQLQDYANLTFHETDQLTTKVLGQVKEAFGQLLTHRTAS